MQSSEREQIVLNIYKKLESHCIGIYAVGSQTLSYIKNCNDYDYIFLYDTESHMTTAKEKYIHDQKYKELRKTYHLDIHFAFENISKTDKYGLSNSVRTIFGKEPASLKILDNKNFFKNQCKIWYKDILKFKEKEFFYNLKTWYYIYRVLSIIKNDSYILTEEQTININILHNRTAPIVDKRKIINKIIFELRK